MTELRKTMAKQSLKNVHALIAAATKSLPVEEAFVADLEAAIEKYDLSNAREPSQCYKPSSMHCIRNMYFQIIGQEQDHERSTACLIGIGESGTDRHERIQRAVDNMKKSGIDCEYIDVAQYIADNHLDHLEVVKRSGMEVKLRHKTLNISFLCDGIIKYKGEYFILEIKTESIYKWQVRTDVAEEHVIQGTTYSACFGINNVLFLYENRDNCSKKAYVLHVTDDMKQDKVVSRIEECDGYVGRLIVPPKPTDVSKKTCGYCKYKTACSKAGA